MFGSNKPGFSFGGSGNNTGSGGSDSKPSLFGSSVNNNTDNSNNNSTQSGFSFGAKPADNQATPSNTFGTTQSDTAKSGFSFGGSSNPFGGSSSSTTNTSSAKPDDTNKPSTTGFSFGSSSTLGGNDSSKPATTTGTTPSLFGSKPAGDKPATGAPAFSFGSSTAAAAAPAATPSSSTSPAPGSLFGGASGGTSSDNKPTFGFGTSTKPSDNKPGFSFGSDSNKASGGENKTGFSFGAASTNDKKPDAAKTGFSFGAPSSTSTTSKPETKPLFGGAITENKTSTETKPLSLGAPSTTPSLFGNKGSTTPASGGTSGFSFGTKPTESKESEKKPDQNTGATPSLFGNVQQANKSEPDKKQAKFGFGSSTTADQQQQEKPSLFGGAKESTSNSTPSVAQPAPGWLKNKSMEDIITGWTTSLTKYEVQFQTQAKEISKWDRLLVENGDKISNLYSQTVEAQQTQSKIDQLLVFTSKQQDDLEVLLDQYEKHAEELMPQLLGGPEGADQVDEERQAAYSLAETLNQQLDSMGKNLSSMIEEINKISSASTTEMGSDGKGDNNNNGTEQQQQQQEDPLAHIVKILNGHLTGLQWIDNNATSLQHKIEQLQRQSGEAVAQTNAAASNISNKF